MRKRIISLTLIITILAVGVTGRIGYIIFSDAYTVSEGYNSYSLTIDTLAPTLYYNDNQRITNNVRSCVAVIRPNAECVAELSKIFDTVKIKEITDELKKGYPVLTKIDKSDKQKFKYNYVFDTYDTECSFTQLIDKTSSGMMTYIDDTVGKRKINFSIDAKRRLLSGDEGNIIDDNYNSKEGYQLSISRDIQKITYDACKTIKSGCAVVMNIRDSSILACVTKPDNSYVNKPFQKYPVGSVFKLIVSACAIENNCDLSYNCVGKIIVGDTTFGCQNYHKHAKQTLKDALANSCNCYFVNLALHLGKDKLIKTAKAFGFEDTTQLYDNWKIKNGLLPDENDLISKGQLALLGFGQGKLLSTPLQICSSLCTIANDGKKNEPKLVIAKVDKDGMSSKITYDESERVISKSSSDKLVKYMRYVVSDGTGRRAESNDNKSAGKTATAQTGQYNRGIEVLNTWFAGIYPYDNPKYAIVVMVEDGTSGATDCCPIFRTIVEKINDL